MRRLVLLFLVAALFPGVVACRRGPASNAPDVVVVEVGPTQGGPPVVGTPVAVTVTLKRRDGSPIQGATLSLEATMTHAGMKPVFADATEVAPGRYRATVEFTMGGDWIIIVRGTLPDGKPFELTAQVRGVRAE